jgi:hypothetical protein
MRKNNSVYFKRGKNLFEGLVKKRPYSSPGVEADVYKHMNELNLSMQAIGTNMVTVREKLPAFIRKFAVGIEGAKTRNFTSFPFLEERLVSENEGPAITNEVTRHLR